MLIADYKMWGRNMLVGIEAILSCDSEHEFTWHFMNEILGVIFQIKAPKHYFVLYYAVQVGWRLTFEFDDAWNKSFMPCTKQHFPDESICYYPEQNNPLFRFRGWNLKAWPF